MAVEVAINRGRHLDAEPQPTNWVMQQVRDQRLQWMARPHPDTEEIHELQFLVEAHRKLVDDKRFPGVSIKWPP